MRTAVISMVRNEADVIETWLNHHLNLFDDLFIADHLSDDGTYEFLKSVADADDRVHLIRYEAPSYDQDVVFDALRRQVLDTSEAELLFVLDADEFLPFDSTAAFQEALEAAAEHNLMRFPWRNAYPSVPDGFGVAFDGFASKELSGYGKIAMRRHIAADGLYRIPKGAHWLEHSMIGVVEGADVGELLHFPVRSIDQIWRKVMQGCEAYLAIPGYDGLEGAHWIDLLEALLSGRTDWSLAPILVHDYGSKRTPETAAQAIASFEPRSFQFITAAAGAAAIVRSAAVEPVVQADRATAGRKLLARLQGLSAELRGATGKDNRISVVDGVIRHPSDLVASRFSALPPLDAAAPTLSELTDALDSAFRDIEDRAPSAWGEHIPFLFALIALVRPRRYVELGVHNGTSFFAACQAMRFEGVEGECIAVDNWIGDPHAGAHSPNVFNTFVGRLFEKYSDLAGFIRKDFAQASEQFAPGSVDLLHIDGFHTLAAVRGDFNGWLDKLSDHGVVLFHDTNEFQSDFGVWRFWRLIRERYPFIEFGHGHGLGVLVVGEKSRLRGVLQGGETLITSPRLNELYQVVFGNLGRLNWSPDTGVPIGQVVPQLEGLSPRHEAAQLRELLRVQELVVQEQAERIRDLQARLNRYDRSIYGRARSAIRRMRLGTSSGS